MDLHNACNDYLRPIGYSWKKKYHGKCDRMQFKIVVLKVYYNVSLSTLAKVKWWKWVEVSYCTDIKYDLLPTVSGCMNVIITLSQVELSWWGSINKDWVMYYTNIDKRSISEKEKKERKTRGKATNEPVTYVLSRKMNKMNQTFSLCPVQVSTIGFSVTVDLQYKHSTSATMWTAHKSCKM